MTRLGIIEDNLDYRRELVFHLRRAGFEIVLESDGHNIDQQVAQHPADLLILDLGLPDEDGLSIARRLRAQTPQLGIVILTARGALDDRLLGLEQGADAYLVKPVDFRELVAVLDSVQRRLTAHAEAPAASWCCQPHTLTLIDPEGRCFSLTASEAAVLAVLAQQAPEIASRESLAHALGHDEQDYDYRRLELTISRLRRKIQPDATQAPLIRAARGRGYLFAAAIRVE
ncbi:MAG: response regulator transcription factor [Lamprobacter sp.]|uniref:response regulator transcription factor n=1 Tax=Lamprobacter sp. TaxID=3100796 RepID=UPI002B26304E|nr:response regulator transcription factor [Lamprobacter sp.]MEA3642347.1 response regulator transcription factor [Lamprobacter sp.]